jgi:hypothetical protein
VLAAVAAVFGAVAVLAARDQYRDEYSGGPYDHGYGYYPAPYAYGLKSIDTIGPAELGTHQAR